MTGRARYVKRSEPYKGRTCLLALPLGLNIQVEDPFLLGYVIVLLNPKELLQHHLAFICSIVHVCLSRIYRRKFVPNPCKTV